MALRDIYLAHLRRIIQGRIGKSFHDWFDAWEKEYASYQSSDETALGLALLYPGFYYTINGEKLLSTSSRCEVRGNRSFGGPAAPNRCDWDKLTGSYCEFKQFLDDDSLSSILKTAKDHVWPFGLGGRTVDANCVVLCRWHNGMVKGADNSYYEYLITHFIAHHHTRWISESLENMHTLMRR